MGNRNFVQTHKIKTIQSSKGYSHWLAMNAKTDEFGEVHEPLRANPDALPEKDTAPTEAQMLMGEAIEHLQGRQKEVYLLIYRYEKSMAEVAEILDISKSAVQIYKNRAVKFLTDYIQGVLKNGDNNERE